MNESSSAIICLGASCLTKVEAVEAAFAFIATLGTVTADSRGFLSDPEFSPEGTPLYQNRVLALSTTLPHDELHRLSKNYETAIRTAHTGKGVAVDIDIVVFNNCIYREKDAASDYFRKGLELAGIKDKFSVNV